jgi:hypothetical protein
MGGTELVVDYFLKAFAEPKSISYSKGRFSRFSADELLLNWLESSTVGLLR